MHVDIFLWLLLKHENAFSTGISGLKRSMGRTKCCRFTRINSFMTNLYIKVDYFSMSNLFFVGPDSSFDLNVLLDWFFTHRNKNTFELKKVVYTCSVNEIYIIC